MCDLRSFPSSICDSGNIPKGANSVLSAPGAAGTLSKDNDWSWVLCEQGEQDEKIGQDE